MKFLDFSGRYTQFQKGVLRKILEREISKEQAEEYMKMYWEWKIMSVEERDKKIIEQAK